METGFKKMGVEFYSQHPLSLTDLATGLNHLTSDDTATWESAKALC